MPKQELDNLLVVSESHMVYRRTIAGQGELIGSASSLSQSERQLLAMVTGYTPLQVLVDLAEPANYSAAINRLVNDRLIEQVNPPMTTQY